MPSTTTMELIARTRIQFDSKSICISTIGPRIMIIVSITIHNDIITSIFELGITRIVSLGVFTKPLLQTRIFIAVEATEFYHAVRTLQFHTIISSMTKIQSTIMPVVCADIMHHSTIRSSFSRCRARLTREIKNRAFCITRIGEDTDSLVSRTRLIYLDRLGEMVSSSSYIKDITCLQGGKSLDRITEWFVNCHTITSSTWCQIIIFGRCFHRSKKT